jgi:heme-degrading monooxygenase HmoA
MYAAVRQYELGKGSVQELLQIIESELADRMSELPGFISYHVAATGGDEVVSLSLFRDKRDALRSNEVAAEFASQRLQPFELNLTAALSGEVAVSRGASPAG